jgi:NADPH:quinone reductase-like Zn-dependent oxidoreductase
MRALEIRGGYGIDALTFIERPDPVPEPGQIVLRMSALSLNYRDLLVINGVNRWRPSLPRIPVSDGVGNIVATGAGVSRHSMGQRVAPLFYPQWIEGGPTPEKMASPLGGAAADGLFAEYAVVHEKSVVAVPDFLSDEEAATLPCAGLTAWNGVAEQGRLEPGDTAVVLGTGGVALFALQFARLAGARVIVTSSTDEKLARAIDLGAADGINYRTTPDWPARVVELTGGGATLVVDTAGNLREAIAAVRMGGTVSFIGLLQGMTSEIDLVALMGKSARVQAVDVGSGAMFEAMNTAMSRGGVLPVIDRIFDFSEARKAFAYLESRSHFGKVCIRL